MLIFRSEKSGEFIATARKSPSLLLLEPHPLYRAALRSLLESPRIKVGVDSASSLEECTTLLLESAFDLVVAAITPELTPRRVLAAVAQARMGVPVLFLAESRDLQGRIEAMRAGATGTLTRDATPEDFVAAIQAALRGRRSMDEAKARRQQPSGSGAVRGADGDSARGGAGDPPMTHVPCVLGAPAQAGRMSRTNSSRADGRPFQRTAPGQVVRFTPRSPEVEG